MTGHRRPLRRIDLSHHAQTVLNGAIPLYGRLYDVLKNMEWHLEHTPDHPLAEQIDDEYWLMESRAFLGGQSLKMPGLTLLYRFDDSTVYVRDVRVLPPPSIGFVPPYE